MADLNTMQKDANPQEEMTARTAAISDRELGIGVHPLSRSASQSTSLEMISRLGGSLQSDYQLDLGYAQVFETPVPNPSSVARTSSRADKIAAENDEVHAAYIYFMADRQDKNLTSQCIHCGQRKVKNVTRQRQHILRECPVLHPVAKSDLPYQQSGHLQQHHTMPAYRAPNIVPQGRAQNIQEPALSQSGGPCQPVPKNGSASLNSCSGFNANNFSTNQGRSDTTYQNSAPATLARIPSGANHPLSTYYQPPASQYDSQMTGQSARSEIPSSFDFQAAPWMVHHRARDIDTFPLLSTNSSVIKIESESHDETRFPPFEPQHHIHSSRTPKPPMSVETKIAYDEEDSEQDQTSDDSDSGSDEGSDDDSASRPDDDDDEIEETFPFDDEDDDDIDDDANEDRSSRAATRRKEGQFGPNAIHKRRRAYKGGKRGPPKGQEPSPEFTALQNEAMRVFIDEQDNTKAMRLAQQAIGVNPEFYSAHALLSEIYFAQGEDQKAINALYFGAHAAPRDPDIWQGVADACLRLKTIDRATALRQALNCFRRIIEIDENNHNALFQRAAIFHEMKSLNRALHEYENLLKVMPHNTSVIRRQAPLLLELDRADEAIKVCEDSIAHGKGTGTGAEDEFSWPDIVVYTDILAQCGRLEEAILKLKRLSRWLVDREMEHFWDEVVDDDREWDSEHEPRRIEALGFHPNLFPNDLYGQALPLELRVKLGLYRLMLGLDYRVEAFGHFEWLTPDNLEQGAPVYTYPELFLDTAKALKDVKEHQEALRYYEALLATEAYSDTSFWLQVAATSFICEKTEQSRICYEAAKAADRNCVEARTQLGMLYAGLGDKAKALQNAEEAVEMATRGIKKSDRRRYEKKDQKAARKAAEQVLKIARRLERPRKKRPRRALGPAQLKRKQDAIDRKAQKLAMKIDKQTKIYERKASKNTDKERSNEIWTSKMKQLYSNLNELTPAMRNGDPQARIAWLGLAQQLVEDFCSTEALFPSEKHLSFQGYKKAATKKPHSGLDYNRQSTSTADDEEQGNSAKTTWVDLHDDYQLPTEHRTIPFPLWLDIFLETALLHAKSGAQWKEACYALLRSAIDCIAWHHDSVALLQIYTCYFTCALELHDERTLLFTVGRWFVKEYRFCTDAYRLFAALNLLYIDENGGKPSANQSEFRNPTTQKFILRQMGVLDARLPEDYNEHGEEGLMPRFMRTTFARGLDNVQEDGLVDDFTEDLKPKEMDVVLLCLYGHIMFAGDTFVSALNYFYRALTLDPKNPMVLLSIALSYAHELSKRGTEDRHMHVLNTMAVFDEYVEARLEQASGGGDRVVTSARREVEFNRARLWQMLGLSDLALREYHNLLQPTHGEDLDSGSEEWSMKAAFAASSIYASNGDAAMAKHITERWLVVE